MRRPGQRGSLGGHWLRTASIALLASLELGCTSRTESAATEPVEAVAEGLSGGGNPLSGALVFFNEFPGVEGNGRTCNTCHVADDGFQLSPAHVEARWQALQRRKVRHPEADDALFRSIDADDFANDFTTLRNHGLVRVTIQLASNVRVLDDPSARSVSLWRATPTVFNVVLTAPYQWDGRFADLQAQALGALHGHAEIGHEPPPKLLNDIAAFQKLVYPNAYSRQVARSVQEGAAIPAEPPATGQSARGQAIFARECVFCHGGPALNQQQIPGAFGDVFVSKPLPPFADPSRFPASPSLPIRTWAVTLPDGSEFVRPSTDPGKMLLTGNPLDFQQFEISQLRGLAQTAPYFHDNSANSLQDVGRQYQALFVALSKVVPGFTAVLDDDEIEPLAAYLNTL